MSGMRSAQPDDKRPAADKVSGAFEQVPLAELYGAIERTAELFRADLRALDGEPLTLPDRPLPMPVAPTAAPHSAGTALAEPRPAQPANVGPPRAEPLLVRADTRQRRRRWLGALILVPALIIPTIAIANRQLDPAMARGPAAAQVASPPPTIGAPTTVAAPLASSPASTPTPEAASTSIPVATAISPTTVPAVIPTTVPTTVPAATPTLLPTATIRPTATTPPTAPPPTVPPLQPTALASRVAEMEAGLRSGTFDVAIDYGQGRRSSVIVNFDLSDPGGARRLALEATSIGLSGQQRLDLLAIGGRIWQRQPGGAWQPGVSQDGLWEQFQSYLPQIRNAQNLTATRSGEVLILRWADPARGADLELQIAASDGRPLLLREATPANGMVMVVTYSGWNTPVSIVQPGP